MLQNHWLRNQAFSYLVYYQQYHACRFVQNLSSSVLVFLYFGVHCLPSSMFSWLCLCLSLYVFQPSLIPLLVFATPATALVSSVLIIIIFNHPYPYIFINISTFLSVLCRKSWSAFLVAQVLIQQSWSDVGLVLVFPWARIYFPLEINFSHSAYQ